MIVEDVAVGKESPHPRPADVEMLGLVRVHAVVDHVDGVKRCRRGQRDRDQHPSGTLRLRRWTGPHGVGAGSGSPRSRSVVPRPAPSSTQRDRKTQAAAAKDNRL